MTDVLTSDPEALREAGQAVCGTFAGDDSRLLGLSPELRALALQLIARFVDDLLAEMEQHADEIVADDGVWLDPEHRRELIRRKLERLRVLAEDAAAAGEA